jgi:hypothetical protein
MSATPTTRVEEDIVMNVLRFRGAAVALCVLSPSGVRAEGEAPKPAPTAHERGGLLAGITGGLAMGTAAGFPNDLQKIDDPNYYGAGGFMMGESAGGMLMGAFAQELSFGVWFHQSLMGSTSGRWRSEGFGGGFRVEIFPLGWLLPALKDLGIIGQFGIGAANLRANVGAYPGAEGVQSYVGAGAFYEWMFAHPGRTRWVVGPSVEYQLVTSRPMDRSAVMLGLRVAFYTGR